MQLWLRFVQLSSDMYAIRWSQDACITAHQLQAAEAYVLSPTRSELRYSLHGDCGHDTRGKGYTGPTIGEVMHSVLLPP